MAKDIKLRQGKKQLNRSMKGRVEKKRKTKPDTKFNGKQNGKSKKREVEDSFQDQDDSTTVKKKPSKAELKSVIDGLKRDPGLLLARKALKYIPFYMKSEGLLKKLLKEIIKLWAESGEKIRVVCLLCLVRIYTKLKDKERKQTIIKNLYESFLEKCRITKQDTMSMIAFMRHSLVELYKLDPQIAFKQAQTSCQQLSITLRNACTHKNEETYKTVLNWQFANCLILLTSLIISHDDNSPVKSLTHQVIQLNLGSLNLLRSPRYYPFYCHLIENLINLTISTSSFIPIMPLLMGILDRIKLERPRKSAEEKEVDGKQEAKGKKKLNGKQNKKGKKSDDDYSEVDDEDEESSINESDIEDDMEDEESGDNRKAKEYNLDLLNHVSLDEAHTLEYNLAVLDRLYDLILKYSASQCNKIAFPELMMLPCVQLKKWLKQNQCDHTKKWKILFDKIKADVQKVEEARKSVTFEFTNYSAVDAWEKRMKDSNSLSLPKMLPKPDVE